MQQAVFHLLFSKAVDGNEESLQRFKRGLAQLRGNGRIEQYLQESRQGEYIKAE